jgi:hypothetical protein
MMTEKDFKDATAYDVVIDPNIMKYLDKLSKATTNFFVAGGFPLSLVQSKYFAKSRYSDIDIWCNTDKDFKILKDVLYEIEKNEDSFLDSLDNIYETDNAITFSLNDADIQLVKKTGTLKEIINEFDLISSRYFMVYPFKNVMTYEDPDTIKNITLSDINIISELQVLKRVVKYHIAKSMNLSEDVFKAIMYNLQNPDNIDTVITFNYDKDKKQKMPLTDYLVTALRIDGFLQYLNKGYLDNTFDITEFIKPILEDNYNNEMARELNSNEILNINFYDLKAMIIYQKNVLYPNSYRNEDYKEEINFIRHKYPQYFI